MESGFFLNHSYFEREEYQLPDQFLKYFTCNLPWLFHFNIYEGGQYCPIVWIWLNTAYNNNPRKRKNSRHAPSGCLDIVPSPNVMSQWCYWKGFGPNLCCPPKYWPLWPLQNTFLICTAWTCVNKVLGRLCHLSPCRYMGYIFGPATHCQTSHF